MTGTLWQGQVREGDRLRAVSSGREVRVRGVQVHDGPVEVAEAGQRVALNLAGVSLDEIGPGEALAGEDVPVAATTVLDAELDLRDAKHNQRVQVLHGTRAVAGRIVDRKTHWQLRLEQPLLAQDGDRVVVRSIAPPGTLGGGVINKADARQRVQLGVPSPPKVHTPAPSGPSAAALDARGGAQARRARAAARAPSWTPLLLGDLRHGRPRDPCRRQVRAPGRGREGEATRRALAPLTLGAAEGRPRHQPPVRAGLARALRRRQSDTPSAGRLAHPSCATLQNVVTSPLTTQARRVAGTVADKLPSPGSRALAEPPPGSGLEPLMGEPGPPVVGHSFGFLQNSLGLARRFHERYGPVFWTNTFGTKLVMVLGPEQPRDRARQQATARSRTRRAGTTSSARSSTAA